MIKEELQRLSEDDLRKKIVIPMMKRLGCFKVEDWCGPREGGKDVLYMSKDTFLDDTFGAIILKNRRDITKSRRDDHDVREIKSQIEEAMMSKIINPFEPVDKISLHELCVMTSYEINKNARQFIHDSCGRLMPYIKFIDGDKLVRLIQRIIGDSDYLFDVENFKGFCETTKKKSIEPEASTISYKGDEKSIVKEQLWKNKK